MPSSVELHCVDPSLAKDIWPHASALVKKGMSRADEGDFDRTEREVLCGLQLLWIGWNGSAIEVAGVTQLVMLGDRKVCVIVAFAANSNRDRWLPLLSVIERFAKAEGCAAVRIIGRKGWERVLENYRAKFVVMDKELE